MNKVRVAIASLMLLLLSGCIREIVPSEQQPRIFEEYYFDYLFFESTKPEWKQTNPWYCHSCGVDNI